MKEVAKIILIFLFVTGFIKLLGWVLTTLIK